VATMPSYVLAQSSPRRRDSAPGAPSRSHPRTIDRSLDQTEHVEAHAARSKPWASSSAPGSGNPCRSWGRDSRGHQRSLEAQR